MGRTEPFHRTVQVDVGVGAAEPLSATVKVNAGPPAGTELGVTLNETPACPRKAEHIQATINNRAKSIVSLHDNTRPRLIWSRTFYGMSAYTCRYNAVPVEYGVVQAQLWKIGLES